MDGDKTGLPGDPADSASAPPGAAHVPPPSAVSAIVDGVASRRTFLALGAVAASTVVTVRPALAQTAGSVLNCQIPVPDPSRAGQHIAQDGSLVAPGTPGAVAGPGRPLTGEEVKIMLRQGSVPPGVDPAAARNYSEYIRKLQQGMSGFTCYASIRNGR